MSRPIKKEFETHTPDAMGILLHYMSEVFGSPDVPILARAKPSLTAADQDIVERALDDGEATAALMSHEHANRGFLDCMAIHFNHMHYSDVLLQLARVGQLVHDETEKLERTKRDHARRFEAYMAVLFRARADDGRLELALPVDPAVWAGMVARTQADMETYRGEYAAAARRAGELVAIASELFNKKVLLLSPALGEDNKR
ncbi:hypothetical protein ANO14919_088130 [Xylariales sp. No.14919]|nr:hypothetical protein ANO14919_088130 [Xylariales sp. No.14919]